MSALPAALGRVRPAVEHRLTQVLEDCHLRWEDLGQAAPELLEAAGSVLSGGKRMRAVLGAVGCAILSAPKQRAERLTGSDAVHLGTALELYQASALVHDDLMDSADTRRGLPAAHRVFARNHEARGWLGRPQTFGANGAILLGDLLLSLAGEEMSALAPSRASSQTRSSAVRYARSAFDAMTTEVALGQFLDVRSENLPLPWDQEPGAAARRMQNEALSVVRHKSARYSVRHPLLIGALLAGLDPSGTTAEHLAAFGEDVGIAFQLRDDDLGVFGSPQATGKPAGEHLREGKRTVLLALTWAASSPAERTALANVLGVAEASADEIAVATQIVERNGRNAHEAEIANLVAQGHRALDASAFGDKASAMLRELCDILTARRA